MEYSNNMEQQYLDLLEELLLRAKPRETRNATVYSSFGHRLSCNLEDGFPLLTTKRVFFRGIVEELAWFLRGSTNVQELRDKKVHIWDLNTEDKGYDAGPVYGFQWRHFGANYTNCNATYKGKGIDQIENIIQLIKNDPHSRRMLLSAWNPSVQHQMALPPCHISYQFYVENNKVSCQMYQRSADVFLGLPFNIASTALLTHLIAHETGKGVGTLSICIGDAHLYSQHYHQAFEQVKRQPMRLPTLRTGRKKDGLWNLQANEVVLENYEHHGTIKAEMIS